MKRARRSQSPPGSPGDTGTNLEPAFDCPPAGAAIRAQFLQMSIECLETISYLKLLDFGERQNVREMIYVSCAADDKHRFDLIEADVRTAWKAKIARGKTSLHLVRSTPRGFQFRFTVFDSDVYLSGVYEIVHERSSGSAVVQSP